MPTPGCINNEITYQSFNCLFNSTGGLAARRAVAKLIWPYMLSIGIAYFVTLCLFPGIESDVLSCALGGWMPVILMAIFNATDFCGKVHIFYQLNKIMA